jgi:H+/Cl- antiporter ClcA
MVERVLTRHFIDHAIANDVFGNTSDARRWSLGIVAILGLLGGLAAMLVLPDARTIQLTDSEAVRVFSRPDRIMAIVGAMVGSGLLSCAIWPWMVFDRRDVEALTGLPLSAPEW